MHEIIERPFDKLDEVKNFQKDVAKNICRIELRKSNLIKEKKCIKSLFKKRLTKSDSLANKQKMQILSNRVIECKQLITSYKFFIDGILFSFFDRFEIKPFFLNEKPGEFRGKSGRQLEWACFNYAFKKNTLAILTDITTVLKNFDIILFKKNEGFLPLELKSSKNENIRTKKQFSRLNRIFKYIESDTFVDENGEKLFSRRASNIKIKDYRKKVNTFFEDRHTGVCKMENGFYYIIDDESGSDNFKSLFDKGLVTKPIICFLNNYKFDEQGYAPFAYMISNQVIFEKFIQGKILLSVVLDHAVFTNIAKKHNLRISINDKTGVKAESLTFDCNIIIGGFLFNRLFFELLSPEWLIKEIEYRIKNLTQ